MEPGCGLRKLHDGGGSEGEARIKAACGQNYQRLAMVKRKYDPANLFRVNQNIPPAS